MSPKKRPVLTGEAMDDLFAPTGSARSPSPYDQKFARHTYRISDDLHLKLTQIAQEKGVGLNDLVRYIFQTFVRQYEADQVDLPVREYVVTRSRLSD